MLVRIEDGRLFSDIEDGCLFSDGGMAKDRKEIFPGALTAGSNPTQGKDCCCKFYCNAL